MWQHYHLLIFHTRVKRQQQKERHCWLPHSFGSHTETPPPSEVGACPSPAGLLGHAGWIPEVTGRVGKDPR